MLRDVRLASDLIVADVLTRWPEAAPAFLEHRMGCVGCAMAPFDTLADVARVYHLNLDDFLADVQDKINHRRKRDEDHRRIPG